VAADSLAPALTAVRLEALQHQADFLAAQGFIPTSFDVTAWSADLLTPQATHA
jgi:ABC-type nitrate/sulfonate/bicarbonate transport system substrate-binding protein